jgi:hypothetical protein
MAPSVAQGQLEISARAARITLGGRLNVQYATSSVDGTASQFFQRRSRLQMDMAMGDFLSARLEPDFAGGGAALQDAWARMSFDPAFAVSVGQFKRAFSLIEISSSTDLPIIERDGRIAGVSGCAGVGGVCSFSRLTQRLELDGRDQGVRFEGRVNERLSYLGTLTNGQGLNSADVNGAKSASLRLDMTVAERVSVGVFGATHDYLASEDSTKRAPAFGADLSVGTWRDGLHVLAAVVGGENWRLNAAPDFLTAQVFASYYVDLGKPRLAGIEPMLRVSWADPDRREGESAGSVITPGLMLYFLGKNGLAANLDLYEPPGAGSREWSLKMQTFLYF